MSVEKKTSSTSKELRSVSNCVLCQVRKVTFPPQPITILESSIPARIIVFKLIHRLLKEIEHSD